MISGKFLFDDRYILYSKIRPYLRKAALACRRGLCSADVYPMRPGNTRMTREFLCGVLLSETFSKYAESVSARANIPEINRMELLAFRLNLPPLSLQHQFAARVTEVQALEAQQAASRQLLDHLFQSMLHRAFRGEL